MLDTLLTLTFGFFGLFTLFVWTADGLDMAHKENWGVWFWLFAVSMLIVFIIFLFLTIIYVIIT